MEAASVAVERKQKRPSGFSEGRLGAAMMAPSLVVMGLVAAFPIGYAIWLSLNEYSVRVAGLSRFVGFDNYTAALSSVDPGHGFVFANVSRPVDAAAAAALSASGTYGPLLLTDSADHLPPAVKQYLLDVQPGYGRDPVRGVYNHGWVVGDETAISIAAQSRIDTLLEIVPVKNTLSR